MRYCLINPPWNFDSSIYFGCRETHLPLEFGYSKVLLQQAGHDALIVDAQADGLALDEVRRRVAGFHPDFTVITTAPSYLFWRCAPPELRVPMETAAAVRDIGGTLVIVGPHASTTPKATLRKLGASVAVLGECEEIIPLLSGDWRGVESIAYDTAEGFVRRGAPHASDMGTLPALHWPQPVVRGHIHHHHRFDAPPEGPGAEMETSRGCPYHCTFCAKDNFRNSFRRRPLGVIGDELDGFVAQGIEYVYFIDEIFLPYRDVLQAIGERRIKFGIQTRIDLWNEDAIRMLGEAGCVSVEAGVESITEEGRARLDKKCRVSTADITRRLLFAKERAGIPFVQANLMDSRDDDAAEVEAWRAELMRSGVWANKPVPMFPYPGSPDYRLRWGAEDDMAWERAHESYLASFEDFSDVQDDRPFPLVQLEMAPERDV
ncbi:MAG TPA: TIGR04295 family B12-binding domain-containing radical SAM protein [Bryobacteraceae bacterium]|jgi:B12-binding domain/radical SAM domain protein of rhizo-twelve system|nr:TIGR04295 family B12-binding domain-containing radical SAM protein [Bryobacteraceae bacterium]